MLLKTLGCTQREPNRLRSCECHLNATVEWRASRHPVAVRLCIPTALFFLRKPKGVTTSINQATIVLLPVLNPIRGLVHFIASGIYPYKPLPHQICARL